MAPHLLIGQQVVIPGAGEQPVAGALAGGADTWGLGAGAGSGVEVTGGVVTTGGAGATYGVAGGCTICAGGTYVPGPGSRFVPPPTGALPLGAESCEGIFFSRVGVGVGWEAGGVVGVGLGAGTDCVDADVGVLGAVVHAKVSNLLSPVLKPMANRHRPVLYVYSILRAGRLS